VKEINWETGFRYNIYIDHGNDESRMAYCDSNNKIIEYVEYIDECPIFFLRNNLRYSQRDQIQRKFDEIDERINDLEYGYLDAQLIGLKPKINETKDRTTKEQLEAVKKQIKARMQQLRPVEKSGGLLGLFTGSQANGDRVRLLLDEFQQLNAL